MKETVGRKQAKNKPSSTKAPEDLRKNKTRVEEETSDEDGSEMEDEPEVPPPPKKKKKAKIIAPGDSDQRVKEARNDLPYSRVPAVKPAVKVWKPWVPGSNADLILIVNKGPAYRTRAPVQTELGDNEVVMNSPVTVTTRDLLDISPGVRKQVKKNVTKH